MSPLPYGIAVFLRKVLKTLARNDFGIQRSASGKRVMGFHSLPEAAPEGRFRFLFGSESVSVLMFGDFCPLFSDVDLQLSFFLVFSALGCSRDPFVP